MASAANADGLRGIEIGDACAEAYEAELALGSQPTRERSEIEADGLIGFSATHEERPALISYRCANGHVESQLISFRLATEVEAREVFADQYDVLRERFGPPCTDLRELSLWQ